MSSVYWSLLSQRFNQLLECMKNITSERYLAFYSEGNIFTNGYLNKMSCYTRNPHHSIHEKTMGSNRLNSKQYKANLMKKSCVLLNISRPYGF